MNRVFLLCLNKLVIIFPTIYLANIAGLGYSLIFHLWLSYHSENDCSIFLYDLHSYQILIFRTYYHQLFFYVSVISYQIFFIYNFIIYFQSGKEQAGHL